MKTTKKTLILLTILLPSLQKILTPLPRNLTALPSTDTAAKDNQDFNFAPGFAGMPFPPMLMNGPHFHPPTNININALPFPNPRANSPYKAAIGNALHSLQSYDDINEKLDENKVDFASKLQIIVKDLDEQYSKIRAYIRDSN